MKKLVSKHFSLFVLIGLLAIILVFTLVACDSGNTNNENNQDNPSHIDEPCEHTYSDWVVTTPPTCTEDGERTRICTKCGDISKEKVNALGHSPVVDPAVAPTCTETGFTEGSHCLRCQAVLVAQQEVAALGHNPVVDEAVSPTCTKTGLTEGNHCSHCGAVLVAQIVVEAVGHDYEFVEFVWVGYTAKAVYVCSRDTGHIQEYNASVTSEVTTPQTCTATGIRTYAATYEGHTDTKEEVLLALGHNYNTIVTQPTCTSAGFTTHTCTRCNNSYIDNYTNALGHNYNSITTVPTCTTQGYISHTCSICGNTYNDNYVDAYGHDYNSVVTAPTCTIDGFTTHTCSRCGDTYKDNYINAMGHDYIEYGEIGKSCALSTYQHFRCANCGDEKSDFVNIFDGVSDCHKDLEIGEVCQHCGYSLYTKTETMVIMDLGGNKLSVECYGSSTGSVSSSLRQYVSNVFISNNVTSIDKYAFYGCTGLTSISIPDSVISIGDSAFSGCTGLTSVNFGNNINYIGYGAFYECSGLTEITIPNSVKTINGAFGLCSNLQNVIMADALYTSINNFSTSIWYKSLSSETVDGVCYRGNVATGLAETDGLPLTAISLKEGTIAIANYAFSGNDVLVSIDIPDSVAGIGARAFARCRSLESITLPDNLANIEELAFVNCIGLTSITGNSYCVAKIAKQIERDGDPGESATSTPYVVTITSGDTIESEAFWQCSHMQSIIIPTSITTIGYRAFYECVWVYYSVYFDGTKLQWAAINKDENWFIPIVGKVHCTDGDINLE